jgi:predicted Zn-dependent peptidase
MKFQKKVLGNGLTILHEKRDVPVTTVMLGVKYGSAYELESEKGIAHFIEHLCFKGTSKRTTKQVAEEIEKVGGDLNAFTSEELTAYYAKLPSRHLGVAMDVIFDIFFNASFPEVDVEREANVICEEIKMYHDNPRAWVLDQIKQNLYEKPFGMFDAGTEELVRGMNRDQLFNKHREIYVPKNSVLCVVGNNDFDEVVKMAEQFVVEREGVVPELPEISLKNDKESEERSNLSQANLAIGIHLDYEKERYVAEVFSAIFGEGMSSKLFEEVREKRGLVYGIKSDLNMGKSFGYLVIYAGTDKERVEEVIKISLEEFGKMGEISEEDLATAKVQVVGNREVESEDSNDTAINLISEEMESKAEDYYNYEAKINEVTLEDIRKFSEKAKNYSSFVLK